ncbi:MULTISPECIES: hypothetical protein [Vibrio]|nr:MULTISPECIES: hypothetical protein [Vibrio]EGR9008937.1 hypothetical protein [Vibrio vulnificus]EMC2457174.1 hypothetical protein [Vibrio cholerae]KLI65993.1 hypothetical protein VVYB158_18540 [Vibrio vulnificus CladeA-yb158]MBJ6893174.1 hypothetical protein [Vibrio cholerae]MBJ6896837.1 hypothetical protein [Vibrio cholerae]
MSTQDAGNHHREQIKSYLGLWGAVEMQALIAIKQIKAQGVTQQRELQSVHQENWEALKTLIAELENNQAERTTNLPAQSGHHTQ